MAHDMHTKIPTYLERVISSTFGCFLPMMKYFVLKWDFYFLLSGKGDVVVEDWFYLRSGFGFYEPNEILSSSRRRRDHYLDPKSEAKSNLNPWRIELLARSRFLLSAPREWSDLLFFRVDSCSDISIYRELLGDLISLQLAKSQNIWSPGQLLTLTHRDLETYI